ncbi:MAG TPA: hypothetical protein VNN80_32845 [Polyangiaceae bacterium]|nr:hypothetical protein [Polyangiaceae bacterium]
MAFRFATLVAGCGLLGSLSGYACSAPFADTDGLGGSGDGGSAGGVGARAGSGGSGNAPGGAAGGAGMGSSGPSTSEPELEVEPGVRLIVSGGGFSFVAFDQRLVHVDQAEKARAFAGQYTSVDANSIGRPCALDTEGAAHCFDSTGSSTTLPLGSGFTQIIAHDIAADACVLNAAGDHLCWQFPGMIDAVRGARLVDTGIAPCVLTAAGMLECSGTATDSMPPRPAGPYFSADTDGAQLCGSKVSGGIECSGAGEPPGYVTLIPSGEYVKVEIFAGLICALTRAGELTCWNSTCLGQPFCPAPFDGVPLAGRYRDITLNTLFPMAIRQDGAVVTFVAGRLEESLYRAYTDGSPPRLAVPQRCEGQRVELNVEDLVAGRTELRATDLNIYPGTVSVTEQQILDLRTGLQVTISFEGEAGSRVEDVSCE